MGEYQEDFEDLLAGDDSDEDEDVHEVNLLRWNEVTYNDIEYYL